MSCKGTNEQMEPGGIEEVNCEKMADCGGFYFMVFEHTT
jgi:hypothetical protein